MNPRRIQSDPRGDRRGAGAARSVDGVLAMRPSPGQIDFELSNLVSFRHECAIAGNVNQQVYCVATVGNS